MMESRRERDKVEKLLEKSPIPLCISEISRKLGICRKTAEKHLLNLRRRKKVKEYRVSGMRMFKIRGEK